MKNRVLSWLLVAAMLLSCLPVFGMPVHAEETAAEGEDLFSNATCSVGVKQTEVTNGSNEAWKLTPGTDWRYPQFVLGREYDISNHILIMDVMPVETAMDRLHICGTTGATWTSAEIYDTLPAGQWTTVTYDLTTNSAGVTSMSDISFGMRIYSMEETGGLYIDNVRLIEKDTKDLFYGGSSTSMSRQYDVTNGSGEAWKFVPNAADWRYFGITLNGSHDITNHKLVVDVMPVDITVARFHITGVSGQSYPSNDTLIESLTPGVWQTIELDLSIAAADEITSIDFGARFDSITGENPALYFDNVRLVEPDTDLFSNAASAEVKKQYNVTNGSNEAWKYTPGQSGWSYFGVTLGQTADISNHELVMDIKLTDMTLQKIYIAILNGEWNIVPDEHVDIPAGEWITLRFDLSENLNAYKDLSSINFGINADFTGENVGLYIDNVRLEEKQAEPEPTEPPATEPPATEPTPSTPEELEAAGDWLYDKGFSDIVGEFGHDYYSYDTKSTEYVKGANSLYSFKVAYDGTNFGSDDFAWPRFAVTFPNAEGSVLDLAGKKLVIDVYVAGDISFTPVLNLVGVDDLNWQTIVNEQPGYQLAANQWTTIIIDFSAMTEVEGKSLTAVHFLFFQTAFHDDQAMAIYLDNARLMDADEEVPTEPEPTEPEPTEPESTEPESSEPETTVPAGATELTEAASDWLFDKSFWDFVGHYQADHMLYDSKSKDFVNGENSLYSFKFGYDGTDIGSDNWPLIAVNFPNAAGGTLDLSNKKLLIDVYVDSNVAFTPTLTVNAGDKLWQNITEGVSFVLVNDQWTTITIDFSELTVVEGKTLTEVHYLVFQATYANTQPLVYYMDNARLVNVCEHDWGYGVTTQKPTLDAEGVKTYTCSKCGETKTEAIDKLVGNGSTVDEWSLTLKGDINVNFNMALDPAIAADPNAYVLFTVDGKEYKFTAAEAASRLTIPVAAAQMKDQIQVTVYDGNGTAGTTFTYCVHQYADYILRYSDDETLKNMVKNMLNYGAKAQEYFDYNTGDLANKDVSVEEVAPDANYNTSADIYGQFEGFEYYGASLVLREKVYIRFYFTAENGVADLTFFYRNEPLTVYKAGENLYFVETAGINPDEYSYNAVITVQQDGNDTTYSVGYSVMNYIARYFYRDGTEEALKAMLKAMYNYHLAAAALNPGV